MFWRRCGTTKVVPFRGTLSGRYCLTVNGRARGRYTGAVMLTRRRFVSNAAAFSASLPFALHAGSAIAAPGATYKNPILGGDHPDASPIRVGSDFYLTHSSFDYAPGLLIWHSRDLVNWKPVGAA